MFVGVKNRRKQHESEPGDAQWNCSRYSWDGNALQARRLWACSPTRMASWALVNSSVAGTFGWHVRRPIRWAAEAVQHVPELLARAGMKSEALMAQFGRPTEMRRRPLRVLSSWEGEVKLPRLQRAADDRHQPAGGSVPGTRLVAAYMDSWTLELVPVEVEEQYQQHRWVTCLHWLVLSRVCNCMGLIYTLVKTTLLVSSSISMAAVWGFLFPAAVGQVASLGLALVPGRRRLAWKPGLAAECAVGIFLVVATAMLPDLVADVAPQWMKHKYDYLLSSDLLLSWVYELLVKWYETKDMLVIAAVRLTAWLLCAAATGLGSRQLQKSLVSLVMYCVLTSGCYLHERSVRLAFLDSLCQPKPNVKLQLGERALGEADGGDAADTDAVMQRFHDRMFESCNIFVPKASSLLTLPSCQSIMHLRLSNTTPETLAQGFGPGLAEGLQKQGFVVSGSYMTQGSLILAVLVCRAGRPFAPPPHAPPAEAEAEQREPPRAMLEVDRLAAHLLSGVRADHGSHGSRGNTSISIQWGSRLYALGRGGKVEESAVQAPEILDVHPRVLPAGMPVELNVWLRMRKPKLPSSLSMVVHMGSASLTLHLPTEAWQLRGASILITYMITLEVEDAEAQCAVHLLKVADGEAFSSATPLLVSRSPQLYRETKGLVSWLSSGVAQLPNLSGTGLLWALSSVLDFHRLFRRLPRPLANAIEAGAAGADGVTLLPILLQELAQHVRRNAPGVLCLAMLLGLPDLLRLLLHGSTPAFYGPLAASCCRDAEAARKPAGDEADPLLPPVLRVPEAASERPSGPTPLQAAVSALLAEASMAGCWATTALHLLIASGSSATLRVLQEEVKRAGLQLDWQVRAAVLVPAEDGGGDGSGSEKGRMVLQLTPMQLAMLRLPASGPVASQAIACSRCAAQAWLQGLAAGRELIGRLAKGHADSAAQWAASLTRSAQRHTSPRQSGAMGWQLAFLDERLESAWLLEQPRRGSLAAVSGGIALTTAGVLTASCIASVLARQPPSFSLPCSCIVLLLSQSLRVSTASLIVLRNAALQVAAGLCPLLCQAASFSVHDALCSLPNASVLASSLGTMLALRLPFQYQTWTTATSLLVQLAVFLTAPAGLQSSRRQQLLAALTTCAGMVLAGVREARDRRDWLRMRTSSLEQQGSST